MSEAFPILFSNLKLGPITLRNRIAMALLTRQMAKVDGTQPMKWPPVLPVGRGASWG